MRSLIAGLVLGGGLLHLDASIRSLRRPTPFAASLVDSFARSRATYSRCPSVALGPSPRFHQLVVALRTPLSATMTDGVTLLRPAASDSDPCSLRSPARMTPARSPNSGSCGSGSASIAAAYMCIAASDRPTITGASPSFGAESATATRFFFVETLPVTAGASTGDADLGRRTVTPLDHGFNRQFAAEMPRFNFRRHG